MLFVIKPTSLQNNHPIPPLPCLGQPERRDNARGGVCRKANAGRCFAWLLKRFGFCYVCCGFCFVTCGCFINPFDLLCYCVVFIDSFRGGQTLCRYTGVTSTNKPHSHYLPMNNNTTDRPHTTYPNERVYPFLLTQDPRDKHTRTKHPNERSCW